jgi:hypothetical protein
MTPDSAAYDNSQTRGSEGEMRLRKSSARRRTSCVTLPPPQVCPTPNPSHMITLQPPPSHDDKLIRSEGNLSTVVPSEVLAQVKASVVHINGEQSKGPTRMTETDKEQWNKVVGCVAVAAQVHQVNIAGRLPKNARMIVSVKPQNDSRAANGLSLCADPVAVVHEPDAAKVGEVDMSANVMFCQASDSSSGHGYHRSSAAVDTSLTECTLTVATGAGQSSEIVCSPSMLDAAKCEIEQSQPRNNPRTDPDPMRITFTSCMANHVETSRMTADALTSLAEQREFTTGKCEVAYQDFDVVPMYSPDLVDRLSSRQVMMPDADPVTCGIKEVVQLPKNEDMQRLAADRVSRMQVERKVRTRDAARSDSADGTYSGGSWEALVVVGKYVPSLLRQTADAVSQLSEDTGICVDNGKLYSGPRIMGGGRTGGCGGGTDMDTDDTDGSDDEYYEEYDSDTPPVNTTVPLVEGARCPVCNAKFKPCKNARPGCERRSAKWNLERHAQKKGEDGDASHSSVAEALRAVDPHLANWKIGQVPPGEVRDVSNWVGHTDQEWRTYTGQYNRHMRMPPADRKRALNDRHSGRALRKCIGRLTEQWQSGAVQFRTRLQTGELELNDEFYNCWDLAESGRERFYFDWEAAEDEREIARRDQEYLDHCRHRPPNHKDGDKRMYLPDERNEM